MSCWSCRNSKYTPRQHTQPRETWKIHITATPLVERILVLGKGNGASLPYLFIILISLSAISALERSKEFTVAVVEPVTKKSLSSSIESLTSSWRIWILDLINQGNDHTTQERPVLIMLIRRNDFPPQSLDRICLFVCFFVGIKPGQLYFVSCVGREVNPLGVITPGQRHKTGNLHVRGSCKLRRPKKKEKKLTEILYHKRLLNLSPFSTKTRYETGNGIVRLLSKASNTGFSRHIKTGCNLPVCITRWVGVRVSGLYQIT